jgi:hypothetical protein
MQLEVTLGFVPAPVLMSGFQLSLLSLLSSPFFCQIDGSRTNYSPCPFKKQNTKTKKL